MANKKGMFFGLYLVFLTIFLCATSIALYYIHQNKIEASLVSPKEVVAIEDNLSIFELREREVIQEALNEAKNDFIKKHNSFSTKDFLGGEFIGMFRKKFISKIQSDEDMKEFIFDNLLLDGAVVQRNSLDENSFFNNFLYKSIVVEKGRLVLERNLIQKYATLRAKYTSKIDFPVDFYFSFWRRYTISYSNGYFTVRGTNQNGLRWS